MTAECRSRVASCVCALYLTGAGLLSASQTRDRTPAAAVPTGTATLSGRVVTTDADARPLSRVLVTLAGDDLPGGRALVTDADGAFVFERLPAGRFTVTGTKPAYLPGGYGVTRPGRSPIPVQLRAGESRAGVTFALTHGAAVSGTLHDANGEAASGIRVAALRVPLPGARPVLVVTTWATTDDRGVFRLYGLVPGDYYVSSMMASGSRVSDVTAFSTAQIDEALLALQRGVPAPAMSNTAPQGTYGAAPMFYPGTPALDSATRVTLAAGEERSGVDFTVRLVRMATIEGDVIDNGNPIEPLIINPTGFELPSLTGAAPTFSWQQTPAGRHFKYTNVVPGRYALTAQAQDGMSWAKTQIEVTGEDVRGITMVMQPGRRFSGRIVFDPGTTTIPNPTMLEMRVLGPRGAYSSSVGTTRMGQAVIPPAVIEADGRFVIRGLIPDAYRLTVTAPSGWTLRSAIANGVDILDRPLEVGTADVTDALLTFTDKQTSLSGTITTAAGQPAPAYFIAIFPSDRSLWRPLARRIQSARAGTDGSWIVRGLPPGDYLIAAVLDLSPEDLADPTFLGEIAPAGVKVTLGEGEQKVQALRISGR